MHMLPSDAALLLMSDHGFGPIEWYVNFNVWLLEQGFIALQDSFYVKQKHWFYRRGMTPECIYNVMSRLGLASHRVSRFRGKQSSVVDRLSESVFLSRRHIDWSRTRAYSQGNFGQIFINLKGRQAHGCVEPADAKALRRDLKAGLLEIVHPETGRPLVEHVYEGEELYHGPACPPRPRPHGGAQRLAVPDDRAARLHDPQGHFPGVRPDRRPPHGRHPDCRRALPSCQGSSPCEADLLDIAPTVLHLLGVPVPADMDGHVLDRTARSRGRPARGRRDSRRHGRAGLPVRAGERGRKRW